MTEWTTIVPMLALGAVIGGGIVKWYDRDYKRHDDEIKDNENRIIATNETMVEERIKAAVIEYRVQQVQVDEKKLDEMLQREMRMIKDTTNETMKALDARVTELKSKLEALSVLVEVKFTSLQEVPLKLTNRPTVKAGELT